MAPKLQVVVVMGFGLLLSASSANAASQHSKKHAAVTPTTPAVEPVVVAPTPPPPPPTPEQMPAVPPKILYSAGQLSITADNSTLADVLTAVKAATGASVEMPPNAGSERVVVKLGPGEPRDILSELFDGSKYDYILLGTPNDSKGIKQIVLTRRTAGGAQSVAMQRPPAQPEPEAEDDAPPVQAEEPQPPVNINPGAPGAAVAGQPGIVQPGQPGFGQPGQPGVGQPGQFPYQTPANSNVPQEGYTQPSLSANPGVQTPQNANGDQQVKTPEQLLQELQRMQQLRQQQLQQQNQQQNQQ